MLNFKVASLVGTVISNVQAFDFPNGTLVFVVICIPNDGNSDQDEMESQSSFSLFTFTCLIN